MGTEQVLRPIQRKTFLEQNSLNHQEREALKEYIGQYETEAPSIADFKDRPEIERQRDESKLKALKSEFEREQSLESSALEMILLEFSSSWLPGFLSKASKYDDVVNHTDVVLEMENTDNRILRLAIDITSNPEKTREKIGRIIDKLQEGWFSPLKYFVSQLTGNTYKLEAPRVVIGSNNTEQINQLMRLYLSYRRAENTTRRQTALHAIEEHPIGQQIMEEILFELGRTVDILETASAPEQVRERKIDMVRDIISELNEFKSKKALARSSSTQGRNQVLTEIRNAFPTSQLQQPS